jgi:hypothetical protein
MTHFELKSMQPPAAPQWQGEASRGDISVMVTVQPVGWRADWHENPKPRWIVPLQGRWWVEAMQGGRREFGPGEFSFGGDQNCRARDGRKGHLSGTLGDEPAVLMSSSSTIPPWRPRSRRRRDVCPVNCSSITTRSKSPDGLIGKRTKGRVRSVQPLTVGNR